VTSRVILAAGLPATLRARKTDRPPVQSRPMKALLVRAWHDPVGSKVISGIILTALGAVVLWAKSGFSNSLAVVWASTLAIWTWLVTPTTLPIGIVVLTPITFAALVWWLIEQRRRAVKQISDRSAKLILDAVDEAKKEVRDEVQKAAISRLVKNAQASLELTDNDKLALSFIYRKYPASMGIRHVAGLASLQYPAAERLCEKLEAHGLAKCISGEPNPPAVLLTSQGRDYCIENGLM
jgi:hypothetical protein